jgi:hypothetical protein
MAISFTKNDLLLAYHKIEAMTSPLILRNGARPFHEMTERTPWKAYFSDIFPYASLFFIYPDSYIIYTPYSL